MTTPERTVERLSAYRRFLREMSDQGITNVFSHQLAEKTGGTAAQVRRDLLALGCPGGSRHGYAVTDLAKAIEDTLGISENRNVVLVGAGNLGRALLAFFAGRHPHLAIVAAFDSNPRKTGRVICGCRCHPMEDLSAVIAENDVRLAIIAVPAETAQAVAEQIVEAGVRGILNFAPTVVRVHRRVFVENFDMTAAMEKVAFFAFSKPQEDTKEDR